MVGILLVALVVRLFAVTNPILDWHAFRQADTAMVTRHYVQQGIDLLTPRYDDIGNVASGLDNPEGYRMVEFPIINAVIASIVKATGVDLVLISRLCSILASLGSIYLLYLLVTKISGKQVGLAAAAALAVLPFNIYYSRVILPEPYVVLGMLGGVTAWWYYLTHRRWPYLLLTSIALSFALLMKPFAIFMYPALAAMAWVTWKWKMFLRWECYALGVTVLPLAWWRWWIERYPEGIPANEWLFNSTGIRLKPSWFKWLFFERIARLMLGWTGVTAAAGALFKLNHTERWVYGAWWGGMIAYLVVIASGNVRHDYYQALLAPIVAITLGKGCYELYSSLKTGIQGIHIRILSVASLVLTLYGLTFIVGIQGSGFHPERIQSELVISTLIAGVLIWYCWLVRGKQLSPKLAGSLVSALVVSSLVLSGSYIWDYYKIHHWEYQQVAEAVQPLLPLNAKVIAPADGDTMFLYQLNRQGWAMGTDIEDKIAKGATHYLSTSHDNVAQDLAQRYTVISQTEMYTLIDLTHPQ